MNLFLHPGLSNLLNVICNDEIAFTIIPVKILAFKLLTIAIFTVYVAVLFCDSLEFFSVKNIFQQTEQTYFPEKRASTKGKYLLPFPKEMSNVDIKY